MTSSRSDTSRRALDTSGARIDSAIPQVMSVDDLLCEQAVDSPATVLVSLTGFGGHEQMLLKHIERSCRSFRVIALCEDESLLSAMGSALPKNAQLDTHFVLPAYPPLRSPRLLVHLLIAARIAWRLPRVELVSVGDIGNHYLVRLFLCVRSTSPEWTYAPMPPVRQTIATRLGRRAARKLFTISENEGRRFVPIADAFIRNLAPGHLKRIGRQQPQNGTLEIYWIGRLDSYQKQPFRALDVLAATLQLGVDCRLNFVGDGNELEALKNAAQAIGIQNRVSYWGWIDFTKPTIPSLPPAGILLNTSDFEGVPLTVLDAMDLGIPCLVREGALTDPDLTAQCVNWKNAEDAAGRIAALWTNTQ